MARQIRRRPPGPTPPHLPALPGHRARQRDLHHGQAKEDLVVHNPLPLTPSDLRDKIAVRNTKLTSILSKEIRMDPQPATQIALDLFRQHGGTLHTQEALNLGIHPRILYALRDSGALQRLSRGLYRLVDLPPLSTPDLVIVARKLPQAVICLVSALAFHNLTTQIPHTVDVALRSKSSRPGLDYPPLRTFWFSGLAWSEGVEVHHIDETPVRIFGPEKSIADCFKYRHKLGLDIALEALRLYHKRRDFSVNLLLKYARICRVEKTIRPYLELLL